MRVLETIVARPWLIALLGVLLSAIALDRLVDYRTLQLKLEIDPSIEALLPNHGEALEVFERMKALYGTDDVLLVAWTGEDLFTPGPMAGLKRFTKAVRRLPGVERVDSLATALNVRATGNATEVEAFLHKLPTTREAAEAIRDQALANPLLAGQLVARNGHGTLLAVYFDTALDAPALSKLVAQIDGMSRAEAGGLKAFVTGPLVLRLEVGRLLLRDLYHVMPLAVLATVLVAALGFRTLRGVLLPIAANGTALAGTLACFAAAGHKLNFLTVILPPVVYVVGFSYAIHVISDFDHAFATGMKRAEAVKAALHKAFRPLSLTALTAAIGFASLAISDIDSIRQFGLYATLGTVFGWACALTLVPAGLMIVPARRALAPRRELLPSLAPALARFNIRHRRLLLAMGGVLAVSAAVAASRIDVSTDYLSSFAQDSAVRSDFQQIGKVFTGAVPLEILIESDIPQAFMAPAQLKALVELKAWLLEQPEIRGVYTLADYIGILHAAFMPELAARDPLPASAEVTGQLLGFGGSDELKHFSDGSFKTTLVHLQSTATETNDLMALSARIEERLQQLPSHLRAHVTGSSYVIAGTIDNITTGQIQSLSLALGVIYVVLVLLFGSFRVAAIALLANALPILVYFGILGAASITLNLTTSIVADVVLGIAIDETIHFLSRFNDEARRVASEQEGIAAALRDVVQPATFTTAALCVGFLALAAGELQNQVQFGLLAATILFIAWLLNFIFTPALALKLRFVTLWDVLALDLGAAPHLSIPLFNGLTARQARIVALLGRLEKREPGARLMQLGEAGDELCVVIDGEISVSLPDASGHDAVFRTLSRGALIGEVALFEGKRSANIDSLSPVQVLWLSNASLKRIEQRYPQIAACLYRNIGLVLASRLVERTVAQAVA